MDKNSTTPNSLLQRFSRSSVTIKSLIALGIVMILIAVVQIIYTTNSTRQQIESEVQEKLIGYFQVYESHVEAETNAASALALNIAARPDIQELYLSGDRDGLYQLLLPVFESMENHQIQHLYIHNPDGTVFLRVHNPERFGDDATYRQTLLDSLQERVETAGVEIGPNRMGVRGVAPMTSNGKFIGLIEVGVDFDTLLISDLKELTGADYTMWVSYEAASVAGLKPTEGTPAASIDEIFYYASTTENRLPISSETYRTVLETGKPAFEVFAGNTLVPSAVYITRLTGYKGKNLGIMEISIPYTQVLQQQANATRTITLVTAGFTLLGLFLIALVNTGVVLRPLQALSTFAQRQLAGDLTARVSLRTGDEFEQLAKSFNNLADTIQEERTQLEKRVTERTKALATSAEVSRRLTSILDPRQLAGEVVNQVQTAFNYYYAQIYLFDEQGKNLVLTAGTGEAGKAMMERGHALPKGRGLVGRAAENNESVLVPDTSQNPDWLPNKLLPDTKAEAAIPIAIGDRVLGVLDVQDDVTNDITSEDITLLESLAAQVAISLQNADSYTRAESALLEAKSLVDYAAEGILVLDLTNGLFSEPNENAAKIYGLSREELVKVGPAQMSPAKQPDGRDSTEKAMEMIGIAMQTGIHVFEWIHINGQGGEVPCEIRLVRLPGDHPRLRVTVTDITERKRLQELTAMRARQQEAINQITQKIQAATTIEDAMQVAARELGHALGKRQTLVALEPSIQGGNGKMTVKE